MRKRSKAENERLLDLAFGFELRKECSYRTQPAWTLQVVDKFLQVSITAMYGRPLYNLFGKSNFISENNFFPQCH